MICARPECSLGTSGKSKYCLDHKRIAREHWKARVAAQSDERRLRYEEFEKLWAEAWEAGCIAADMTTPVPMVVQQRANPLDDNSEIEKEWYIPQGVCGFAWIGISPGTCSFARWVKKNKEGYAAYRGGVQVWIGLYGQCYEKKVAHARAMAAYIRERITRLDARASVYSGGRLD